MIKTRTQVGHFQAQIEFRDGIKLGLNLAWLGLVSSHVWLSYILETLDKLGSKLGQVMNCRSRVRMAQVELKFGCLWFRLVHLVL